MANGPSVSSRSRAHCARSSGSDRTAVPKAPIPPASQTAAASSTCSHGPKAALKTGTSIPRSSHNGVFMDHLLVGFDDRDAAARGATEHRGDHREPFSPAPKQL